jgi:ATP-binding cassette subfamily B protein
MRITGIFLTIATAKLVIEGSMTLGTMFAINMLIGQLLSPISSIVDFIPAWQDARLAFDRIKDIHLKDSEYKYEEPGVPFKSGSIEFRNVWFSYSGDNSYVLKDISFNIEKGKTTAIVGSSGSGKTSMVKLMLQFYQPTKGEISIGNKNLNSVSADTWRELCGVVLQNGRVFSDTIVNNIALGQVVDMEQIVMTSAMANLDDFVNSDLPMGYFTQIGDEGLQLSEGQKQRLLLARAMYKNPDFLFLDEATSSLDASNERNILTSLREFSKGKTVVIVAHRLSTVRNADKILVIDKGKLVETGKHDELIALKGFYYNLIKDQLTLNQI